MPTMPTPEFCFSSPVFVGDTVLDEQRRFPEKQNEFIYFFDRSMIDILHLGHRQQQMWVEIGIESLPPKIEILVNIISFGQWQQHCGAVEQMPPEREV